MGSGFASPEPEPDLMVRKKTSMLCSAPMSAHRPKVRRESAWARARARVWVRVRVRVRVRVGVRVRVRVRVSGRGRVRRAWPSCPSV